MPARKSAKRKPPYHYAPGPSQRRKLLRELGRQPEPRRYFGGSKAELRKAIGRMFGFKPLVPLTSSELSLLKSFMLSEIFESGKRTYQEARDLLEGTKRIVLGENDAAAAKPRISTIRKTYSEEARYGRTRLVYFEKGKYGGSYGLAHKRGLIEYPFPVLKEARRLYREKRSPLTVLDVGANTAKMLGQLKKRMGNQVEVHGLDNFDRPHTNVDAFHVLAAEYMPSTFRRKFDLITSNRAIEYFLFPHIGLRNIVEALAPGGVAYIDYIPFRFYGINESLRQKWDRFYRTYRAGIPTSNARKFLLACNQDIGSRKELDARISDALGSSSVNYQRAFAWVNEVARLSSSKNFIVEIIGQDYMNPVGHIPVFLKITRKK